MAFKWEKGEEGQDEGTGAADCAAAAQKHLAAVAAGARGAAGATCTPVAALLGLPVLLPILQAVCRRRACPVALFALPRVSLTLGTPACPMHRWRRQRQRGSERGRVWRGAEAGAPFVLVPMPQSLACTPGVPAACSVAANAQASPAYRMRAMLTARRCDASFVGPQVHSAVEHAVAPGSPTVHSAPGAGNQQRFVAGVDLQIPFRCGFCQFALFFILLLLLLK